MANNDGIYTMTTPATMTYSSLITPSAGTFNGKTGDPKFSVSMVFRPDDNELKAMKVLCADLARAKWPGGDLKLLKFPFRSGDATADKAKATGKDQEFMRGFVELRASSKLEPELSGIVNGVFHVFTSQTRATSKPLFYAGAQVLCELNFVPFTGNDGSGITCYLNKVFSTGKGEKMGIGNMRTSAEAFKGYMGSMSMANPMPADSEIPF